MDKKISSTLYPILLGIVLLFGIYLGMELSGKTGEGMPVFKHSSRQNKINQVLSFIERQYVDTISKEEMIEEAIQSMLQHLDPHSYYISSSELARMTEPLEGNFDGIGIEFMIQKDTVVVVNPIAGGPSESLGIRAGDRIVEVNGENIAGIGIRNSDIMDLLRGESSTKVDVGILRKNRDQIINFNITRGKIPIYSVDASLMLTPETGFIKVSRFGKTTYDEFLEAAQKLSSQGMKKLVLDLRNNGGGYMHAAIMMIDEFFPKGHLVVYTEGRSHPRKDYYTSSAGILHDVEVVVLVNENSASASEIVSGAIQDNDRGTIIGRRTYGKGLVQEHIPLPEGDAMRLTTARYYTPVGRSIQKPYGRGIDYERDIYDRYESGEVYSGDTLQIPDSLTFTTPKGKTVYGGGGIYPDIFVSVDTVGASFYLSELNYTGTFNQFAFDYSDKNRDMLLQFETVDAFKSNFRVLESVLNEFISFGEANGVKKDMRGLEQSRDQIKRRLKALIARNIFREGAYFAIINDEDPYILKALEVLAGDVLNEDIF
jgi:carboxyl-terminal processing protease